MYAGRSLAKARAFTVVCVVSLGIGMVPVIAIPFISRIVTMPPAGVDTARLAEVLTSARGPREAANRWSYPDFVDLRDAETGLTLFGWAPGTSETTIETPAGVQKLSVRTLFVSPTYFETLHVALARGSGFGAATQPVVILSAAFWYNRLGSDPAIVGKTLTLDGVPHLVVGIAPDRFEGHLGFQGRELFVPLAWHPLLRPGGDAETDARTDRANEWIHIHGRLDDGVGVAQADAAVAAVTARLAAAYPSTNEFKAGYVEPYYAGGSLERTQIRLMQAVGFTLTGLVLLVVCLNTSGMMQVRSAMRERELSIRQAVGASRGRLFRFLLAESLILAALGMLLATLVLVNLPSLVSWLAGQSFPPAIQEAIGLDAGMLAVCAGLCLAASLAFGWLPATRFSRPVIISGLKDDAGGGGLRVGRLHRRTAALQVAIAVPLIVMSGISLDRVRSTATIDLGFASELIYAAPVILDPEAKESAGFRIRQVTDALRQTSGVASVTVAEGLPLDFRYRMSNVSLPVDANVAPHVVAAHVTRVGDGYLDTMGIPLLRGRGFTEEDGAGAELVTVISNALARELFPAADPAEALGKPLFIGDDPKTRQTLTIVGVMGDFPTSQMSTEREQLLLPIAQQPATNIFLVARSVDGEQPKKLTAALEAAVRELDPDFNGPFGTSDGVTYEPIVSGASLRENSVRDFLVGAAVGAGAGGIILMLAALGIYGVVGLMVATRTREIAVRVALGASRKRVIVMILLDVVKLVLPGVVLGVILTVALMRLNSENMGISLSQVESLAYVAGAAVAVLVAVLASLPPARRAASVPPMVAMRSE